MLRHGLLWGTHWRSFFIMHCLRKSVLLPAFFIGFIFILLAPSILPAAPPPLPFNRWANTGGVIQANCPAGYTCNENVTSDNMLQRILTRNNSGETYVHVIIEDNSAQFGQHSFETFVNASNASNQSIPFSEIGAIRDVNPDPNTPDIVDLIELTSNNTGVATETNFVQTAANPGTPNPMTYNVKVNSGWALTAGQPAFELSQNITDTTAQGIVFDYTFTFSQNRDANGIVTGNLFGIDQFVANSAVIGAGNAGTRDDQRTVLMRASGNFITAGTITLPPSVGGMGMGGAIGANPANGAGAIPADALVPTPQPTPFPNPPGAPTGNPAMGGAGGGVPPGGAVAWNTGDEVQVIWIGQVCPGCMIGMGGMGGMGGAGSFSFQQYENITSGVSAATRTIQGAAPFVWTTPPFGPQPPGL